MGWNSASPLETKRNPEPGANMPRSPTSPSSHHKTPFPQTLKKMTKRKKVPSVLEQEFLSLHQKRAQVATWVNDALYTELPRARTKPASDSSELQLRLGLRAEE
ncbi:probable RNA-binding protein 19 isoform X2 [Arvicola amphibius]|uniref:probable RNA-binding protein 19 isoform X2 n=1 Tax=Arvicola amphibius TaxID=1047088 RepID=UPI001C088EB6|nr:probable RNA-binding protein 19 isoform X2 [Arvicola amphibius]